MKITLRSLFLSATLLLFFSENKAQTQLLHYWHFNNVPGGIHLGTGKLNSDYTRAGITRGYLRNVKLPAAVKDTGYWDNGTPGDTTNQRPGFGGCCGTTSAFVRTRNPNDSMQFLWYIPTTHFKNIVIKYASQSSSAGSGPGRQKYDYSLDSGLTYITAGLPRLFDSAGLVFSKVTLNLGAITALNNTNKLIFRVRLGTPNTGSSGNTRYDNITVEGDSASFITTGIREERTNAKNYRVFPNPSNDYIYIRSVDLDAKTIQIENITGRTIYTSKDEEKDPIDIRQWNPGIYFIRINALNTKTSVTLKFIKN